MNTETQNAEGSGADGVAGAFGDGSHMAMASGDAIIANPALSIAGQASASDADSVSAAAVQAGHDGGAAVAIGHPVVDAWLELGTEHTASQLAAIDAADRASAEQELRALWGDEYDGNVRAINAYLDDDRTFGAGDAFRHARRPDGHALANDPAELQRLLGEARRTRPAPGGGTVDGEIREIERFMRSDRAGYNRNEPLQARYRELLALKSK